jgi:tetratricopeptide (TPR) repeat protein
MFNKLFGKRKENEFETMANDLNSTWMLGELRFQHQTKRIQFRTNENQFLRFGEIVNTFFDIRKEELSVLTINDSVLKTVEGCEEIWNYEFLKHYLEKDETGKYTIFRENINREGISQLKDQSILALSYRAKKSLSDPDKSYLIKNNILIIHLELVDGIKDKVLYVKATFCLPQNSFELNPKVTQPKSYSFLIGIDYRSYEKNNNEFLASLDSAIEKLNKGKTETLSGIEREILELWHFPSLRNIARKIKSGKNSIEENRFSDAIHFLVSSYNDLQQKWWDNEISDEAFQDLIECSYLIGYCYYELGLYDKAYKYLEFSAKNVKDSFKYQSEYINCLIALKDIRSLMIIDYNLEVLTNKKEEERTENDFFMFLLRRKAYCMIELKQFDSAKGILQHILKNDPENEFAKQEIEYIKQLKNNE